MKKVMSVVLALVMTMSLFYTCAYAQENKPIEISVMCWGYPAEKVAREAQVALFNSIQNEVHVTVEVTSDYDRKLDTMLAAGNAPDVFETSDDWYNIRGLNGQLTDLRPYIEASNLDMSPFVQRSINNYTLPDGMIEALPFCLDLHVMAYNKDLFDAAGVPYPTSGWTWDDALAMAQKLTNDKTGTDKVYGFGDNWMYQQICAYLFGGEYMSADYQTCLVNQEAAMKGINFYIDLSKKYGVMPDAEASATLGGDQRFFAGKVAMFPMNNWDMPTFLETIGDNFAWDIVEMPMTAESNQPVTWYISPGFGIWSGSTKKDAAYKFIQWATTDIESLKITNKAGITAYKTDAAIQDFIGQKTEPVQLNMEAFTKSMDAARLGPFGGIYAEVSDEFTRAWEDINLNNADPQETMNYFAQVAEELLAR